MLSLLDDALHDLAVWDVDNGDILIDQLTALGKARLALEERVKEIESGQ